MVQIHANGLIVIANETYRYTATDNLITLSGLQGAVHIPYQLQGDILAVLVHGQQQTLRRMGPMARAGDQTGSQGEQITRLLLSSAWCSSRYSQTTGTSSSERVQFFPDGTVAQGSNTETSTSGAFGSVAGQHRGGQRGRWRIQNGALMLTEDGVQWAAQTLGITQNSNGYPIVTSNGREYSQCR